MRYIYIKYIYIYIYIYIYLKLEYKNIKTNKNRISNISIWNIGI